MDNALLVDVLHPLRDLPHVLDALPLSQLKVLIDDALEELTPGHAAGTEGVLRPQERGAWLAGSPARAAWGKGSRPGKPSVWGCQAFSAAS